MHLSKCISTLAAGILLCLGLASCEKTLALRNQSQEIDAKISALNQEKTAIEAQLTALRPSFPPAGSNDEAARILYSRAAGELTILEANLKTAAAGLKETEAAIATLKKEAAENKAQ